MRQVSRDAAPRIDSAAGSVFITRRTIYVVKVVYHTPDGERDPANCISRNAVVMSLRVQNRDVRCHPNHLLWSKSFAIGMHQRAGMRLANSTNLERKEWPWIYPHS